MRCSILNRFGTMCIHINDITVLASPINHQIGKQQETQRKMNRERSR
jgi:hypothetical protein